jgi:Na+/proline symporter
MHPLDIAIVVAYLLMMVAVGSVVAKMAAKNPESYFLAGKSLPWWMIGIAHGSSGLDISGTMWFVMVLFVYGAKGVWLLWVWPLFNVIFRMVYLGTWVRRSNVLTGAEWMYTRFGRNTGSELAYASIVVYAIVSVVGFLSMAYIGIGKFTASFIPFETLGISAESLPGGMTPADFFAIVIMLIAGLYCVVGGMYSVVMNDMIQFALIVIASVIIGVIAMHAASSQDILAAVPAGWDQMFFGWRLDLDWSGLIPSLNDKLYNPIGQGGDGYSIFGLFVLMLLFKGVLVSMAGPTPNYAIQHVLSTRSPREAALENLMMAIASLAPRFLLIAGIGTLGIVYFGPELRQMAASGKVDFEQILPSVVNRHLPIGAKGLILAGLLAAFMSTFVSTVNSGAAYIVNDIYKRYLAPKATPRRYVILSYLSSIGIIALGIAFGFATKSVHSITEVLVSVIVPAFVIPNVIKWHWWRFNGYGFFAGMVAGTLSALVLLFIGKPEYMSHLNLAPIRLHPVYVTFPIIMILSTIASVGVCLLTKPEEDAVLMRFYRTVRPWGFWTPIYEKCRAEDPTIQPNRNFWRDWFNIVVGIVWELAMVAGPIFLVIQQYSKALLCAGVFAATSLILKFTWYNNLEPEEKPAKAPATLPGPATD